MQYGLYLSATGVMTNSYRQDAIANNLANSETTGFKRDITRFQQRLTAAEEQRMRRSWSNPLLDKMTGGTLAMPNSIDTSQGDIQPTGSALDVAIEGKGYFLVNDNGKTRLTRAGSFALDRSGNLSFAGDDRINVLSADRTQIKLKSGMATEIDADGNVFQDGKAVAKLAVVNVPDETVLRKHGGNMFDHPDTKSLSQSGSVLRSRFIERANVDPAIELTQLIEAQRQLEANANMIRFQDQMLSRLVTDVGKI